MYCSSLPANYLCASRPRDFWVDRHPVIRWAGLTFKNVVGAVAVALGVILSMPGVPGPGLLLIGIMLLDFPGQLRRLARPEPLVRLHGGVAELVVLGGGTVQL